MTLIKSQIIDAITEQTGFTRIKSTETIETILEIIKSTLASDDDVMINGFRKLCGTEKLERAGKNPATGEEMMMAPWRVVAFRCSGKLRASRYRQDWEDSKRKHRSRCLNNMWLTVCQNL